MKLRVCVEPDLTLIKEKRRVKFGDTFEVDDKRGFEILKATFKGKPVVKLVEEKENVNCSKKKNKESDKNEQKNA